MNQAENLWLHLSIHRKDSLIEKASSEIK